MVLAMFAGVCLALAALPALLYLRNVGLYRPPPMPAGPTPAISVLIPARNEERSIGPAIDAARAAMGPSDELIVLDDHSTDKTADIVRAAAALDPRIRLEPAPPLPEGWCGKQHACAALGRLARHDVLVFVDADVRLAPDGLRRLAGFLASSGADLVSGIPRQETGGLLERLVLPLIHFLLLGFLPVGRMRASRMPGLGAGCGQLFMTTRAGYEAVGGHGAVRTSLHDGITLPRAYRRAGRMTDLCDATPLAVCRMYRGAGELWHGLAKNAREGLAAPRLILFSTTLLVLGHVLPPVLLAVALAVGDRWAAILAGLAVLAGYYPRLDAAWRFRQSWLGALLHPVGVLLVVAIQWYATVRAWAGRPVGWKGRAHPSTATAKGG